MTKANTTGKPVIIEFCIDNQPCSEFDMKIYSKEEIIKNLDEFIKIKVDMYERNDLVNKYLIQPVPTVVFLNSRKLENFYLPIYSWEYLNSSKIIKDFLKGINVTIGEEQDFSYVTLEGEENMLSDFRGKIILVDFMAVWCTPCQIQMQWLQQVKQHYEPNGSVVIISIDTDLSDTPENIKNKFYDYINEWTFARDVYSIAQEYLILSIPTIYIFDGDGKAFYRATGVRTSQELISYIDELLD